MNKILTVYVYLCFAEDPWIRINRQAGFAASERLIGFDPHACSRSTSASGLAQFKCTSCNCYRISTRDYTAERSDSRKRNGVPLRTRGNSLSIELRCVALRYAIRQPHLGCRCNRRLAPPPPSPGAWFSCRLSWSASDGVLSGRHFVCVADIV